MQILMRTSVRLLVIVTLLQVLGCAGHAAQTAAARTALDAGRPRQALAELNDRLDVKRAEDVPADVKNDKVLFVLDRSMVLMQLGRYDLASRDLEIADKQLMVLDFAHGTKDDIGKYLFSDDTGPYRAPAYEKLLVNTMNMMNYLARGNLEGARVEARRMSVLTEYFKNASQASQAFVAPGSYLAGFIFEKSGQADEALRYYDEALARVRFSNLDDAIGRLATRATYRSPRLEEIIGRAAPPVDPASTPTPSDESGEVLVVVNYGRVPPKIAERVPIGLALTFASGAISPYDANRANALAAQGLVTWVNFPSLGRATGQWATPSFAVDGQWQGVDSALGVDLAAQKAWEEVKGTVVASAITRMIARVVAGEVVRRSTKDSVIGMLLSLGTQATLTAVDTPDTRSWSTLPARIAIGRLRVKAGTHIVEVSTGGDRLRQKVTIRPSGWAVVVHTVLR
jgi:uncharacterized protein